jgi:hypothetical protein
MPGGSMAVLAIGPMPMLMLMLILDVTCGGKPLPMPFHWCCSGMGW